MDSQIEEAIVGIHGTPHKSVLAVAGAGSGAMSWLLGVSGASRTLLETLVPYGRLSMIDLVGQEPAQYVSPENARDMARAAYRRGLTLLEDDSPVVGVACTATIATDRPKRGDHRACIAIWDEKGTTSYNLKLDKGKRGRTGEEEVVSRLLIQVLAEAYGVEAEIDIGFTDAENPVVESLAHPNPVQRLLSGDTDMVMVQVTGEMAAADGGSAGAVAVLPGSFNPLHEGHLKMAEIARLMTGLEVVYELAVLNVDKPPLEESEIRRRLEGLEGLGRVALTRTPTFWQKSELFPGGVFVIGWDTMIRLIDPRYYGNSETTMLTALAEIWARGCRFLVAGRQVDGNFRTLDETPVPQGFQPLFQAIPEAQFRADISSTELRTRG
ncbi:MAG: hypothetical protein OXI91_03010 [Chloroflexota bacterium]|nr:hypothetical protein [Chloroflexota bacterium]